MSRPTPRAYYEAQLDKAMQNNDTKKINSLMGKLQSLNKETPTASPMPRRRRRPTADPRPTLVTKEDTPRRRRRPTADPRPAKVVDATATGDRREALARARARQRAKVLRGVPKVGDPRTRGQMSNFLKELRQISPTMKRAHKAAQKKALKDLKQMRVGSIDPRKKQTLEMFKDVPKVSLSKNAEKTLREKFANMPRRGMTRGDLKTKGQLSQITEAQRRALMTRRPQQPKQELPEYAKNALKTIKEQQQQPRRLTKQQKQQMNFSSRRDAKMKNIRDRMMKRGRDPKDIQRRLFEIDNRFLRRGFNRFGNPSERAAFDLKQKQSKEMFNLNQSGASQKEMMERQTQFENEMRKVQGLKPTSRQNQLNQKRMQQQADRFKKIRDAYFMNLRRKT